MAKEQPQREKEPKLRVGIYARVSTKDQKCELQLQELRRYCRARAWIVEGEYVDQGFSGKKAKRPAFDRLVAKARERRVDAVVVWKVDRWGRSLTQFVSSVQELDSWGVRFIAASQGIDTSRKDPMSQFLMKLLALFADFEHDLIAERTLEGLQAARAKGIKLGPKFKVFDRAKAHELHSQGLGVRAIAKQLGGVSHMTIQRVLKQRPAA